MNWAPQRLVIAGYTNKDQEAVKHHIEELKELGVPAPRTVPMMYDLSPELLSNSDCISVVGNDSSGEAEVVLLDIDGTWYIGLGSDHTDRVLETVSIQKSKQVCAKMITRELWTLESIAEHWDEIELNSWVQVDGEEVLYQSGALSAFLNPMQLLEIVKQRGYDSPGIALYCGTLPLKREFHFGGMFKAELHDKKNNKTLTLSYETRVLKDSEMD
ncbi:MULTISPECIES: DUF2848 domain-containing protein [unclassified Paenibacillus]|uniref:DUF2848 domain-containing protein n=1 Tax=unclassified Paenibacillus TaxID=185978 RepID=UPI001AE6C160|nr:MULTISPECIES: DUF2848 domain-containing protein [unclassified Paenibacillus]MBP1157250.1 hypothetical protein [Paenibacillus sp. PvP091]MBP2438392.1 hypothetical protein [Paenibacillus sp. PvP052]